MKQGVFPKNFDQ